MSANSSFLDDGGDFGTPVHPLELHDTLSIIYSFLFSFPDRLSLALVSLSTYSYVLPTISEEYHRLVARGIEFREAWHLLHGILTRLPRYDPDIDHPLRRLRTHSFVGMHKKAFCVIRTDDESGDVLEMAVFCNMEMPLEAGEIRFTCRLYVLERETAGTDLWTIASSAASDWLYVHNFDTGKVTYTDYPPQEEPLEKGTKVWIEFEIQRLGVDSNRLFVLAKPVNLPRPSWDEWSVIWSDEGDEEAEGEDDVHDREEEMG